MQTIQYREIMKCSWNLIGHFILSPLYLPLVVSTRVFESCHQLIHQVLACLKTHHKQFLTCFQSLECKKNKQKHFFNRLLPITRSLFKVSDNLLQNIFWGRGECQKFKNFSRIFCTGLWECAFKQNFFCCSVTFIENFFSAFSVVSLKFPCWIFTKNQDSFLLIITMHQRTNISAQNHHIFDKLAAIG